MKRLIIPVLALLLNWPAFSLDFSHIKFEYLTVDDGLSQGTIEDILQDNQGMMWFATRDGLDRYDGERFTVFRNNSADSNSIASNWILCIGLDSRGRIWIGSGGLNVWDPEKNTMKRIPVNPKDPKAFHGGSVYDINMDRDSTLWISSTNGLVHYFPQTNEFKTYDKDSRKEGGLITNLVYSTLITRDGKMYVGTVDDPIFEFNRIDGSFKPIYYKTIYSGANFRKYIQEDKDGLLYISAENSGVHIYNPITGETKMLPVSPEGMNAVSVKTRLLFVSPDQIWIGTDGGGINVYNPQNNTFQYILPDTHRGDALNNKAVFKIFQDKDKNIWVGHFNTGISVWKKHKEKFLSYRNDPFDRESLNKEVVSGIFQDSQGRIWIGQDGGGLNLFHPEEQKFEHFMHQEGNPQSLTTDVILAINEDPDGNLLLGTYSGGLMIFDPAKKKVIRAFTVQDGLPSMNIWNIFKDGKGRYWITFLGRGVSLFDPKTYSFINYNMTDPVHKISSSMNMHLAEDKEGRIWIGSENNGVCVLDPEKNVTKNYIHSEKKKNTISNNDIKSIVFTGHYAWVATNGGGLNRIDLRTDSVKIYDMTTGLTSDALMSILVDGKGYFWISSTRGLMKFDPKTGQLEKFDKSQGLQGTEFKYNSQCRLTDGRMMFGGVNGLTVFHPDSIRKSGILAPVVFTDFKVFNESAVPGAKGSPLKRNINFTDRIVLHHKQSVFTIEFAAIDYNATRKNQYRYMLKGLDEDWVEVGNRNYVTYTNLKPGKYVFMLQGSNSDGEWNKDIRKIVFRIRPPWYKTIVAILLFILTLAYLVYAFVRERIDRSARDKKILQEKIDQAQAELDVKVNELERQQEEIRLRDEREKNSRYQTEGVARISDVIAKQRHNLEYLSNSVIAELVRYLDASAGDIFIMDDSNPSDIILRATGDFSFSTGTGRRMEVAPGEGYVGTCFVEHTSLNIDNLPDDYVKLKSGLGEISLRHIVLVPLMQDADCVGVIEVASVKPFEKNKIVFIEKIAESLSAVITIIKANEKTNQMLEQNNVQAEELRAQEEEMRQNLEELMATQEASRKHENQLTDELKVKTREVEQLRKEIERLKAAS